MFVRELVTKLDDMAEFKENIYEVEKGLTDDELMQIVSSIMQRCKLSFTTFIVDQEHNT